MAKYKIGNHLQDKLDPVLKYVIIGVLDIREGNQMYAVVKYTRYDNHGKGEMHENGMKPIAGLPTKEDENKYWNSYFKAHPELNP